MYMRDLKNMETVVSEKFGKPGKGDAVVTVNSMQDRIADRIISAATELMHKFDLYDRYVEIISGLREKGEYIAPDFWMSVRYIFKDEIRFEGFWIYYRKGCDNMEKTQVIPCKEILISANTGDSPKQFPRYWSTDNGRNWYQTQYISNVLNGDPYYRATDEESFILNLDSEPNDEGFVIGSMHKKPVLFVPKYYAAEEKPHTLSITIDETTYKVLGTAGKVVDKRMKHESGIWKVSMERVLPLMFKQLAENPDMSISEFCKQFSLDGENRLSADICKEYVPGTAQYC